MPDPGSHRFRPRHGAPALLGAALLLAAPALAQPVPFPVESGSGSDNAGSGEASASPGLSDGTAESVAVLGDASAAPVQPVRFGALGNPIGPVGAPGDPNRAWTVVPSLGVQQLYTDNLYVSDRNKRSEFITTFSPGLFVSANTSRLTGSVGYAPLIEFYANTPGQDRVDHNFNGQVLATLVPGFAYLDLRGNASTRTATGGFTPEGTVAIDRNNRVQTTVLQATPYIVQRFGGFATGQLGYALSHSSQSGQNAFLRGDTRPYFSSPETTSNEIFGVLRSGPDFGRLNLEARASGTTYTGTGVLDGAHRASASLQVAYALTRVFTPFVEGGYENQRYGGVPPIEISGPIWSVGARITPGPESIIVARYGRRDGFNSASLEAGTALGGRTRLNASYSERLTTDTLRNQDILSSTSLDSYGQPADRLTGAPANYGNSLLGTQDSLRRVRRASAGITRVWTRDTVTLSAFYEKQEPVSTLRGSTAFAQRGYSTSLSWSHELTPVTSTVAYLQYGRYRTLGSVFATNSVLIDTNFSNGGSSDVATAGATLFHRVTPRLTASLQYALTRRGSSDTFGGRDGGSLQNLVLVALRQTF